MFPVRIQFKGLEVKVTILTFKHITVINILNVMNVYYLLYLLLN